MSLVTRPLRALLRAISKPLPKPNLNLQCGFDSPMRLYGTTTRALRLTTLVGAAAVLAGCALLAGPRAGMGFFVTSAGPGEGANLGGIAGADRHCQRLGTAAGAGKRVWRAYVSQQATERVAAVNARDRIGKGPWKNAVGDVIATDLTHLHGVNNLSRQTALTERGAAVNGRGDTPNLHDILTGSQANGTAIAGDVNTTCGNWTQSGDGAAMVGHHDKAGLDDSVPARSWNSSHLTRGCSAEALKLTGGAGLFYCFAAD